MATDNSSCSLPIGRAAHHCLSSMSSGDDRQSGTISTSYEVRLEQELATGPRGMVSVFGGMNEIRNVHALGRRSLVTGSGTDEQENHNLFTQPGNSSTSFWCIPFGPASLPPIFTIGLGISVGSYSVDLLTKLDQHMEWLFPPTCLPSDVAIKLLYVTLDQLVLLSPHWCALSSEELDHFNAQQQLIWFRQCMHATGMAMDSLISLNASSLRQKLDQNRVTGNLDPVIELCTCLKRYVEEYVPLGNLHSIEQIEVTVFVCLQLIVQAAVRHLEEVVHSAPGTSDNQLQPLFRTTSWSNLTTMTSYNSLASTSSSVSCDTVASNALLKSDASSLVTHEQSVPSRMGSIQPAQVISVRLSESPTNAEKDVCVLSVDSMDIGNAYSLSRTVSSLSPKRSISLNPQEAQPLNCDQPDSSQTKSLEFPLKVLTPCDESANSSNLQLSRLSRFKSHSLNDLHSLVRSLRLTDSANLDKHLVSLHSGYERHSQTTPDVSKIARGSLLRHSKLTNPSDSKVLENSADYETRGCSHHPMLPLFHSTELPSQALQSGDQTLLSQSTNLSTDSRRPSIRDMLNLKLISCTLIELITRLGSVQDDMINLLPVFHSPRVFARGNQLIDQTVAVALTHRMNQLTSSAPMQLSQLITSAPMNVGLIMDKLLLDNLRETTESITTLDATSFPGFTNLHRHVSNLVDEVIEASGRLNSDANASRVRADSVVAILSALWAAAYPAACFAIDRLLIDRGPSTTCSCSYSKPEQSIESQTSCLRADLSLQSDVTYRTNLWTTLVSTISYHMPAINLIQSFMDSELMNVKPDEPNPAVIASDDVLKMQNVSSPTADSDDMGSECSSPQPITCVSDSPEKNTIHYISVRTSQSDLTSRSSSLNNSLENIALHPEPDLTPSRRKVHLSFDLSYATQSGKDALGEIILKPHVLSAKAIKTAQSATTTTTTTSTSSVVPDLHNAIRFCPSCTNKLLACLRQTLPCSTVISKALTNQDVGVQCFLADTPAETGDKSIGFTAHQICTTTECDLGQPDQIRLTSVVHKVISPRNRRCSVDHCDKPEDCKLPNGAISQGRSQSQSTLDDSVISPSTVYQSISQYVPDRKTTLSTNKMRELYGSTRSQANRTGRSVTTERNPRQWPDPSGPVPRRARTTSTKPNTESERTSVNEECFSSGMETVQKSVVNPVRSFVGKVNRQDHAGLQQQGMSSEDKETDRDRTGTLKNALAVNPFYSCLKELRDFLSRAEARLTLVDFMAKQQQQQQQQQQQSQKSKLDSRVRLITAPTSVQRLKPFGKSAASIWSPSLKHYASQVLLSQPRREAIPPKKQMSLSNLVTSQTDPLLSPNHAHHSPGKTRRESKPAENVHQTQTNVLGARWTVDEIRPRGPGQFPSPCMELPVRAHPPVPNGTTKHPAMLGKITAHRAYQSMATGNTTDTPLSLVKQASLQSVTPAKPRKHESAPESTAQRQVGTLFGRIGTVLSQNGPRSTQRLCNTNRQTTMV